MVYVTNVPDSGLGPDNIPIFEHFLLDTSWPADLTLDLEKSNWQEWRRRMDIRSMWWGFGSWLDGSLECPDQSLYPDAHRVWKKNDHTFRKFILKHISADDYQQVYRLDKCHDVFEKLRKRHELLGIYAQAALVKKAFQLRYNVDTPFSETILEIDLICERIIKMGTLTPDRLYALFIVNALGDNFPHLRPTIEAMVEAPGFLSDALVQLLRTEDLRLRYSAKHDLQQAGVNPAKVPVHGNNNEGAKAACSNCKRSNHITDFCIKPGGKMAGRSIKEARAAQSAALRIFTHGRKNQA
ncbi:hypothetical protein V8E52_000033 [Russula decolorans]|jgi:hypothetical protein